MVSWRGALGLGFVLGSFVGCDLEAFTCESDVECLFDEPGVCQPSGFCSFPDDGCDSGQRYGRHSSEFSGTCVASPDAGPDDPTTPAVPNPPPPNDDPVPEDPGGSTTADPDPSDSGDTGGEDPADDSGGDPAEDESGDPPWIDPDLALWLEFEDAVEDGVDDSSSLMLQGHCDPARCPALGPGFWGDAVYFDGVDDLIEVEHGPHFETPAGFTVAARFWLDEAHNEHQALVTKPFGTANKNSWELLFYPTSNGEARLIFNMHIDGDSHEAKLQGSYPVGQWVHVAATWDGTHGALWVDGVEVDTASAPGLDMDDNPILIGADNDHNPGLEAFFSGRMDDVRIYQRALDAGELEAIAAGV